MKRYLSVRELVEMLPISKSHAYNLVARGEIPSHRAGRRILLNRDEVEAWLNDNKDNTNDTNERALQ